MNHMTPLRCCPACGADVATTDLMVFPEICTVTRGNRSARLTRQQTHIMQALATTRQSVVAPDRLLSLMYNYGESEPDNAGAVLKVQVCRMRPKLAPLGVRIKAIYHVGYVLEVDALDEVAA